ncbi:WD40-repeat-containing domain protein [Bombardia bombarda]|uniref:WD40-repeat-containing domain protein n=1 Tax=Bombardia bombarda TaxID=252184 RepID=A0AA39X6Q5_9PEZI|nr:WD40-repeat-containing domain protein [Bombardia bombarda]
MDEARDNRAPSQNAADSSGQPAQYITASLYDIVPTMAAPMATSVNAIAITPDLRYWLTGGSDGYIRKYDGMGTINGKQQLTVAQKHPFVDSVVKAGIMMNYWENDEPSPPNARTDDPVLSPVYSLAVHSSALWLLSGLESGGINLQSVRHDEGKKIHCLRENGHTNAVSVLQLASDEQSVLSGSWDKSLLDWDLNNGRVIRRFDGSGGQISAIELRPANGAPIPAEAAYPEVKSETLELNNSKPLSNGFFADNSVAEQAAGDGPPVGADGAVDGADSPEHRSLFGSPAGSLFGDDNDTMGGAGAFGNDDDDELDMGNGEFPMGDADMSNGPADAPDALAAPSSAMEPGSDGANPGDSNGDMFNNDATMSIPNGDVNHDDDAMDFDQPALLDTQPAPPTPPPPSQPFPLQAQEGQQPQDQPPTDEQQPPASSQPQPAALPSPSMVFSSAAPAPHTDPTQTSSSTFLSAAIDGTIRIWDRRAPDPVARINNRPSMPPWCMGACWSPDGNWIYAGRRNGTVEEFSIHRARGGWQPERVLRFPHGSGAVSCVRPMVNGRHLVCASHDIIRLYDLRDNSAAGAGPKHSRVPFTIIPGPPRAGVISSLYIDPTSRIMISAGGTRGWDGTSTEVLIGYEISVAQ